MKHLPKFPPLLNGHRIAAGKSPLKRARAMVSKGELGAGDLLWSEETKNLSFCVILEPEVPRAQCQEMLFLMMVAFGDALGALAPPEMAVTYSWPNQIQLNDAFIGHCGLEVSKDEEDGVPQWMIVSLEIAIKPENIMHDPGEEAWRTTLWEEGCGDISRTELLESTARHFLNWMHGWDEEGFKPVHDQWTGRLNDKAQFVFGLTEEEFMGMDEYGNALIKSLEGMKIWGVENALHSLRKESGNEVS